MAGPACQCSSSYSRRAASSLSEQGARVLLVVLEMLVALVELLEMLEVSEEMEMLEMAVVRAVSLGMVANSKGIYSESSDVRRRDGV